MTYDVMGAAVLNYAPCRYGNSRVLFRGPERRLDAPYVAFWGGTETYGKFIKVPFPALVESNLGINCVNFGIPNAGVDVFLNEPILLEAASGAKVTVLQIVGAQNLSNRFYSVHPRRNDRFLRASPVLCSIFPEVDFAEFHFTRHMLTALHRASPERFEVVRDEVREAWVARMRLLIGQVSGPVLLLWFANHAPDDLNTIHAETIAEGDPLFVTRKMIDDLRAGTVPYVEVVASPAALSKGTEGMVFSELEHPAASRLMGPQAHGEAAAQVLQVLQDMI